MSNYDIVKNVVKMTAGLTNDVLLDNQLLPSIMVKIPKFTIADVITGGSTNTHPAFIINGTEVPYIYVSKYRNCKYGDLLYSLPLESIKADTSFATLTGYCVNKGTGWHVMTIAEYAAVALWCRQNATMPKGNNDHGKDITESTYQAIPISYSTDTPPKVNRVLSGSGPVTWSHDGAPSGIWDLNGGNIFLAGYRTVAGEIQIMENNNAADSTVSQGTGSSAWKAVLMDGTLVAPGTADTLKWDYAGGVITLCKTITTQANTFRNTQFKNIVCAAGVTCPGILKALALYPVDNGEHGGDYFSMNNGAGIEKLCVRGGDYTNGASAGVFYLLAIDRDEASANYGIRSNYYGSV